MPTRDERDKFSIMIEEQAVELKVSHMEMVLEYCSKSGMEVEVAASLINPILKSKIETEAKELRFIQRTSSLPI